MKKNIPITFLALITVSLLTAAGIAQAMNKLGMSIAFFMGAIILMLIGFFVTGKKNIFAPILIFLVGLITGSIFSVLSFIQLWRDGGGYNTTVFVLCVIIMVAGLTIPSSLKETEIEDDDGLEEFLDKQSH